MRYSIPFLALCTVALMSEAFAANPQVSASVTDSITQTNVKIVGEAPAEAMANVTQTLAHDGELAYENAVQSQAASMPVGAIPTPVNGMITDSAVAPKSAATQKSMRTNPKGGAR